jgi:hypothetical protein
MFGGGQPVFAEEAISEPGWVCGLSNGANVLKRGRPTFSDSANASANERDSRIDDHARTPQTLSQSALPDFFLAHSGFLCSFDQHRIGIVGPQCDQIRTAHKADVHHLLGSASDRARGSAGAALPLIRASPSVDCAPPYRPTIRPSLPDANASMRACAWQGCRWGNVRFGSNGDIGWQPG